MRAGNVYVNGKWAGVLVEENHHHYVFTYDKDYVHTVGAEPVCLAMPLSEEPYVSDSLFPFFCNLLSEGFNKDFQVKYHHLSPDDHFGLLLKTASYDTIGAVTVKEVVL